MVGEPDAYAGGTTGGLSHTAPWHGLQGARSVDRGSADQVYERPANPKHVTVIEAMPVTAIGKIYKSALRLCAIAAKMGEMLADVIGAVMPVTFVFA